MPRENHSSASERVPQPDVGDGAAPSARDGTRNASKADSPRLASLRNLLVAEPDDGFLLYGLAQEFQKLGRLDEAITHYDRTIAVDPKQCYAFFHKAKALEQAGRRAEIAGVLRAGLARAREVSDFKAASELQAFLDDVEEAI